MATKREVEEQKPEEREKWGNKLEFILSCVGYAVGLGNILRFPYLAGRNGGAAFLIPYVIMMILAGLPAFYMELALGQYGQVTPMYLYNRMAPFFTGVGYSMILISLFTAIYYNLYLAWTFRYFYDTILSVFGESLPWDSCPTYDTEELNQLYFDTCQDDKQCPDGVLPSWPNYTIFRNVCYNDTQFQIELQNDSFNDAFTAANMTGFDTAAATYFNVVFGYNKTAKIFAEWGAPRWEIVLALALAWILICFILAKGIKSSGKFMYFAATFPYLLLLLLLILGLTLDGSEKGIEFYINPNFDRLLGLQIWSDAAQQIFFSLSVGGGGLTTLATYNKFNNNLLRDTLIVVFGNCGTSFFVGFVVFSIVGFISKRTGVSVEELALKGPALAFTSYPDAIAHFPSPVVGKILGIAFFSMMILLAVDTEVVLVEVPITAMEDTFPWLTKNAWRKSLGVFIVCCVGFIAGLPLTTKSGPALQNVMDTTVGGWTLLIAVFFEIICVAHVYGVGRFVADIRMMMGRPPNMYWKLLGYPVNLFWIICWVLVTPVVLVAVIVFFCIDTANGNFLKYNGRDYPSWGIGLGIVWIPFFMLLSSCQAYRKGWSWLFTAGDKWGPKDQSERERIAREHPYRYKMPYSVVQPTPYTTYSNQGMITAGGDIELSEGVNPSAPPPPYYPSYHQGPVRPTSYIIKDD